MKREVKAVLLGLMFALGVAVGALGLRVYDRSFGTSVEGRWGGFDRARYVTRLTRDLELTADQQQQLNHILDDTRAEFMTLRKTIEPQVTEIKQRARGRIRAMLTPEQQDRFAAFLKEWEAEKQRRNDR